MLDVREHLALSVELTFIEPYPDRLETLLRRSDRGAVRFLKQPVQTVPDEIFAELEPGDFLFIDSSHVAKVGSDLADIFSRILPRIRPGVFVHFHDIFFPGPYPEVWLRQGRAWNEVLFLQAFLRFNGRVPSGMVQSVRGCPVPGPARRCVPAISKEYRRKPVASPGELMPKRGPTRQCRLQLQ
jgi:hypothetical protein